MAKHRVAIVSSEAAPFCKVGGLGDVVHALPKHLHRLGHEVCIVMPYYQFIDEQGLQKELVGEQDIDWLGQTYHVKYLKTRFSEAEPFPVYFVYQEELFSRRRKVYNYPDDYVRFGFFNQAVFPLFEMLGAAPDIIHCQDWEAGLIPNILDVEYKHQAFWSQTATVFTIHNLVFQMQGMWFDVPKAKRDVGRNGLPTTSETFRSVNFTLRGIKHADVINTVSERYAQEILTKKFGEGLDGYLRRRKQHVFGIINGVDYTVFNPTTDKHLNIHYDWNSLNKKLENKSQLQAHMHLPVISDIPLIGMAHRLTEQKGFDLIMRVLPSLLRQPVQLVIVGEGQTVYTQFFRKIRRQYPDQVAIYLQFSESMASRVYAGSDMFLMPSRYEPCGISQLISLRYGSIPIVHQTGGLADTITDFNPRTGVGTGFVFKTFEPTDFLVALVRAMETYRYPKVWEHLTWQAMRQSFSWELPARKYVDLYRRALSYRALG